MYLFTLCEFIAYSVQTVITTKLFEIYSIYNIFQHIKGSKQALPS